MTIVTTFVEEEFSISRVLQEEGVHAWQAGALIRQSAVLTIEDSICTLTTVWA